VHRFGNHVVVDLPQSKIHEGRSLPNFTEFHLIAPIQRAIAEENYKTPTPIQAQTIPDVLRGRDILGCAPTGTGKTAAFALPILNRFGEHHQKSIPNCPRALILAPTRELAVQIGESFATYGRHLRLRQALVYGGVSQLHQVRALDRGVHILVATPGRLLDLMGQEHISLDHLEVFVLDEADRMLDMGFLPDLKRIIRVLPERRQSLFFSATLPAKIVELSKSLLRDPVRVNVAPETTGVQLIDQRVMFVERAQKQALLHKVLKAGNVGQALVFTRTKHGANTVSERLTRNGINAAALHGNKSQTARQHALDAFRCEKVRVLVATDLAARGIDVDGITHVINFEMPHEPESYVHRIGRTGRAGASGIALSFCSAGERAELRAIERLIGQKVLIDREHSQAATENSASENSNSPQPSEAASSGERVQRPYGRRHVRKQPMAAGRGGNGEPQGRRRSRRKGRRSRQRVRQTS
jgi:ATP-dependent RNA helicase RhlE